jgi:hypothetical protein
MSKFEQLIEVAVRELMALGYSVESQTWMSNGNKGRANVFGWGENKSNSVVPIVAVEVVQSSSNEAIERALEQLIAVRDAMGTQSHFIFDGDTWSGVNEDFRSIQAGVKPLKISYPEKGVTDFALILPLLQPVIFNAVNKTRSEMDFHRGIFVALTEVLNEVQNQENGLFMSKTSHLLLDRHAFVKALMNVVTKFIGEDGQFITPAQVGEFLFNLIGNQQKITDFYDPFSGAGSNLREASIRYRSFPGSEMNILGREINTNVFELSQKLNVVSDTNANVSLGDSFKTSTEKADLIITIPPLGLRLLEPFETPFGFTNNGDIASISLVASSLKKDGIAAMICAPNWTWSKEGQVLREWLGKNFHVVALISLPPVLSNITALSPVALIIRNSKPGESIVGTLKDDWFSQSEEEGELAQNIKKVLVGK